MRHLGMLTTVALMVVLGACDMSSPVPSGAGPVDVTGDWQMASGTVDGVVFAVVDDAPITLTVEGTQIGGRSACNHYGGEIVVEGERTRFSLTSMTEMACPEPAMAAEAAFSAALPRVVGAVREGDRLTLTGPGVELIFDLMR
jgi:heat shock protein HslJ